jgi:hypothetical protein
MNTVGFVQPLHCKSIRDILLGAKCNCTKPLNEIFLLVGWRLTAGSKPVCYQYLNTCLCYNKNQFWQQGAVCWALPLGQLHAARKLRSGIKPGKFFVVAHVRWYVVCILRWTHIKYVHVYINMDCALMVFVDSSHKQDELNCICNKLAGLFGYIWCGQTTNVNVKSHCFFLLYLP